MLNALRVDVRRYFITKGFMILALIIAVAEPLFLVAVMYGLSNVFEMPMEITANDIAAYSSMAAIYLAVFVTMFLYAEAGEGIIRNKLISGKKRIHVILSYCIVNSALAVIMQLISVLVVVATGTALKASFQLGVEEIIRQTVVCALAGMALSILYSVVFLCFCTTKAAIAIPAGIAVVMKVFLTFVMDALYTDSGVPKVTGRTLEIYKGIDRFLPFAHLTGGLRWDNGSYIIGNSVVIIVSLIVGILVFSKKDLK